MYSPSSPSSVVRNSVALQHLKMRVQGQGQGRVRVRVRVRNH